MLLNSCADSFFSLRCLIWNLMNYIIFLFFFVMVPPFQWPWILEQKQMISHSLYSFNLSQNLDRY